MSELAALEPSRPLTAVEIRSQVNLIQEVMQAVMKKGVHYDVVPGCGDKPTLLKPGAEKLATTFRLAIDPEIVDLSTADIVRFRIRAKVTHPTLGFVGCGVGEASSGENKWKWRAAVCEEEFAETTEDRRREVWKRGKNDPYQVKQIRTEALDLSNTVLKMAKKRALVDAILTCTAASDLFAQDIEELPEEMREAEAPDAATKPPVAPPQRKSQAPPPVTNNGTWHEMLAKFDGKCSGCGHDTKTGRTIFYNRADKAVLCPDCHAPAGSGSL